MAFLPNPLGSVDISTRPKRRIAVSKIVRLLNLIYSEEEEYLNRIPLNLQGGNAYDAAEDSLSCLIDAIDSLSDAY